MGALFPSDSQGSFRSAARRARAGFALRLALPAALASGLLVSCISDGPNRTGGDYLAEHGVILANPLYHVVIKGFPADSFWTTDNEPGHVNDTILLAGRKGAFSAVPRFAFLIKDTNLIDSLDDSAATLRLSLSTPTWQGVGGWNDNGTQYLKALADSIKADSLGFEAQAWDFTDSGLSSDQWNDSLSKWNRRFLVNGDTLPPLPPRSSVDTLWLKTDSIYTNGHTQLQANALPTLKSLLLDGKGHKHFVHIRLVPLSPADSSDTASGMLRLGGQWAYDGARRPVLLFGKTAKPSDSLDAKNRLGPMDLARSQVAVAYTLRYAGPKDVMIVPMQRGLHVALDRDRLFDSLEADLLRQKETDPKIVIPPRGSGPFSLAYYVPYAAITLPILPPDLEAGLPVQVKLRSAVDTALGDSLHAGTRVDSIALGDTLTAWYTSEVGHPEAIVNRISLSYAAGPDSLRRVVLAFSKDSSLNDTVYLRNGASAQLTTGALIGYGKGGTLFVEAQAAGDTLVARSYVVVRASDEINSIRDPATGKTITDLDSLLPRFTHPGDTAIRVRATGGIQALLNRTSLGKTARQDFEFRPYFRAFNPKAAPSSGDSLAHEVVFPLLSTLPPRIESGVLSVDLDVYLYPLRAR